MFLRLQNGITLKAQEKRHAFGGNMRDFVIQISKHPFFLEKHQALYMGCLSGINKLGLSCAKVSSS